MKILISGGTGFIGQALKQKLMASGHQVAILSRSKGAVLWNPEQSFLAENAFDGIDALIHLAGENIGAKRWTPTRKREIIESRTKGTNLLVEALNTRTHSIKTVLFASAIGFYGSDSGELLCTETSPAGDDFMADCVKQWEASAEKLNPTIRSVTFRIGLVLDPHHGIFPKVATPIKFGIGSALGTGKQWQSWIHLEDLCQFFIAGLENKSLKGTYNAVAPEPIQQLAMAKAIASFLKKPFFLPAVPAFVLKTILGEMACLVLGGNKVSCKKFVEEANYEFVFPTFNQALKNLLTNV